ncbi:helix-turn-helix domain-containing protein [Paenibacillus sp. GCM10027628]|uniref:helix-turn-helix domain-containing protein n=1 Tax=Paenibacillus sp. GCM10027628 TaxID=3273413 RepID=UPI0036349D78
MYHALIVDDEAHAVRGLQAGVDWDKLKITEVYKAFNIRQAKEIFEEHGVHILICDIEMPQGTGLELLEWVREHYPETETVFLTCHADFTYAKQAIQLNSFDYLLKPVDYSELEDVVGKALGKIGKEAELRTFQATYKHYHNLWETHQPLLLERFWQDLLAQSIPSQAVAIREHLAKQSISFSDNQRFLPIYIHVQRWYKELSGREQRIMEYAVKNAAEEQIIRHTRHAMAIPLQNGKLLAIIPIGSETSPTPSLIESECNQFIASCNKYFYCDLCCYIGEQVAIHEMFAMVQKLQALDGDNVTLVNRTLQLRSCGKPAARPQAPLMSEWAELMKQGAREKLQTEVRQYLESLKHEKSGIDAGWLQAFYQDFLQMVFFVLQLKGLQAHKVFASSLLTENSERAVRSLKATESWVPIVIEVVMNHIQPIQENLSLVEKVKQFIGEHIGQQSLSREDIANAVYLNPDYLTRVFKKETGSSLSDYLQHQRIELAKHLLMKSEQPVSDIALTAGYSNLSYFSTIFKKAVGLTPADYRKQLQKK